MTNRWFNRLIMIAWMLVLPMVVPANVAQVSVVPAVEHTVSGYDAGLVHVSPDNHAPSAVDASGLTMPLFGPLAGLVAAKSAPDFIVSEGGTVFPVPRGASGPFAAESGKGFQFTGGSGGNGLSSRTTDVRIMDPVTTGKYQYPGGYGSYGNAAGQTVNPLTGQTIPKSDPWWHIPAE